MAEMSTNEPHHAATHSLDSDNADALSSEETCESARQGSHDSSSNSRKAEKQRLKEEKKAQKELEKAKKKEDKATKKAEKATTKVSGRLHMDGMVDKAIRMLYPITREGRKTINAAIKDQIIPGALIRNAKGLAFFTIAKTGLVLGVQGGLGIVIGRKPDGGWSPPCAFQTGGVSAGVQIGASMVDLLLIINTEEQLKILSSCGMVKLGADLEVTVGPLGRHAQAGVAAGTKGIAGCYAYSFSRGVYGGICLDGAAIWPYTAENTRFYGREVKVRDLFAGHIEVTDFDTANLLDHFNEVLNTVGERITQRRRATQSGTTNSNGDTVEEQLSSPGTEELDSDDMPEAVLTYLKERGE